MIVVCPLAAAVRKVELEIKVAVNEVKSRKEPILPEVYPGRPALPQSGCCVRPVLRCSAFSLDLGLKMQEEMKAELPDIY